MKTIPRLCSALIVGAVVLMAEYGAGAESTALLAGFRQGPLKGIEEVVFAVRQPGRDGHWYANFGYYADSPLEKPGAAKPNARVAYGDGGRLCRLQLTTGEVKVILEDRRGGVRDPVVHYDAQKILFSYRPGGNEYYHLYEVNLDGSSLRQLTDGPFDDIEPTYLPDGDILFVSSRCKRWVNCWLTQVAVLHRCGPGGENIRALSSNNEQDNTPWVLPTGQILYTRWEYVDRSQVDFHHLWITSPDGSRQTVFFGNMYPGTLMIDAKPVPGSRKIVASFSPGHGRREHDGQITLVDPRNGPDNSSAAETITRDASFRDPWAFSEEAFLGASGTEIVLLDRKGRTETIYRLPPVDAAAGLQCHEPRPLAARPREPVVPSGTDPRSETGRLVIANVHEGRSMQGVKPGEIKKLLVLETLPKPINFTGGMEPLSYGGTFTLERVLGTVPVEADGSAYLEVPAMRSVFLVALDDKELSVKRMQSFMTVMPGETTTCVGCHEQRTRTPHYRPADLAALRHRPSRIEPITAVPDVLDFPRDIQPILDKHCVKCHDCDHREGGVVFVGDRGPVYSLSYSTMTARSLVADGRNAVGNHAPRTIGSSASRLMELIDRHHHDVQLTDVERTAVRLWIDSGAPYPGTYAALGCGMIGGYSENALDRSDLAWPSTKAAVEALTRRCAGCHHGNRVLPLSASDEIGGPPWVGLAADDVRRRYSRHLFYNLSRPEKSLLVTAPLAKTAGGGELCGKAVFANTADEDYRKVLAAIGDAKRRLDEIKRFDMPGFEPRGEYLRELRRYGILPADAAQDDPHNVYQLDRQYWQSLWYRAMGTR